MSDDSSTATDQDNHSVKVAKIGDSTAGLYKDEKSLKAMNSNAITSTDLTTKAKGSTDDQTGEHGNSTNRFQGTISLDGCSLRDDKIGLHGACGHRESIYELEDRGRTGMVDAAISATSRRFLDLTGL